MRLITMEVSSQSYLDGDICSSFTVLDLPDPRESSDRSRFSLSLSLILFVRRFTRAFNVDRSSLFAASYAIYLLPPLLFYLSFRTRVNKERERDRDGRVAIKKRVFGNVRDARGDSPIGKSCQPYLNPTTRYFMPLSSRRIDSDRLEDYVAETRILARLPRYLPR